MREQQTTTIEVKEQIGEGKKKERVRWSIDYTLPKSLTVDESQKETWLQIQRFDIGS